MFLFWFSVSFCGHSSSPSSISKMALRLPIAHAQLGRGSFAWHTSVISPAKPTHSQMFSPEQVHWEFKTDGRAFVCEDGLKSPGASRHWQDFVRKARILCLMSVISIITLVRYLTALILLFGKGLRYVMSKCFSLFLVYDTSESLWKNFKKNMPFDWTILLMQKNPAPPGMYETL